MQCPVEYNTGKPPPKPTMWWKFFNDIFDGDRVQIHKMIDCLSQAITPNRRYGKMYLLIGDEGTGKSTIHSILEALVGGRFSLQTLQQMGRRFGGTDFDGRYLNSSRDNSIDVKIESVELLKLIATNESFKAERKCVDFADTDRTESPRTLLVHSGNQMFQFPSGAKVDTGLHDRLEVLHMDVKFRDTKIEDKLLIDKLINKLDSLVYHILGPRIKDNMRRNRLKHIKSRQEGRDAFTALTTDEIKEFLAKCEFGKDYEMPVIGLWEYYEEFCRSRDETPVSRQRFNSMMQKKNIYRIKANRNGRRRSYWKGITIKE
ncbi:MAG: hypothetical protein F4Y82_02445 [Cenarchaeum sp. SB0665_bin_23]|nr:hypothetical protein [Cenarchaeum sp. SB0665_bin_23]MYG32423.1 hypothetical protein [Cenarchaeum sp. SB0677_bin_16]